MKKHTHLVLILAVGLGIFGFAFAWYKAITSPEAQAVESYLRSPTAQAKHQKVEKLVLTGFRISGSKSRFTYWVSTPSGWVFLKLSVDTSVDPWVVSEID